MRKSMALLAVAIGVLVSAPAFAAVVFNNFGPGDDYIGGGGNPVGVVSGNNYAWADRFESLVDGQVTRITTALVVDSASADVVTLTLYANESNAPGAVLWSQTFTNEMTYTYGETGVVDILGPTLTTGTSYWLAAYTPNPNRLTWHYNTIGDIVPAYAELAQSYNGGAWVTMNAKRHAFRIETGTTPEVPEPVSLAFFATGLAGVAGFAARRRIRAA